MPMCATHPVRRIILTTPYTMHALDCALCRKEELDITHKCIKGQQAHTIHTRVITHTHTQIHTITVTHLQIQRLTIHTHSQASTVAGSDSAGSRHTLTPSATPSAAAPPQHPPTAQHTTSQLAAAAAKLQDHPSSGPRSSPASASPAAKPSPPARTTCGMVCSPTAPLLRVVIHVISWERACGGGKEGACAGVGAQIQESNGGRSLGEPTLPISTSTPAPPPIVSLPPQEGLALTSHFPHPLLLLRLEPTELSKCAAAPGLDTCAHSKEGDDSSRPDHCICNAANTAQAVRARIWVLPAVGYQPAAGSMAHRHQLVQLSLHCVQEYDSVAAAQQQGSSAAQQQEQRQRQQDGAALYQGYGAALFGTAASAASAAAQAAASRCVLCVCVYIYIMSAKRHMRLF